MALVTCERLGDALKEWLDNASQDDKDRLCEALGCGPSPEEITSVFFDCEEKVHIPGSAIPTCEQMQLAIDKAIENLANASDTIILVGDGTAGNPFRYEVKLSPAPGNRIEIREGGIGVWDEPPASVAVQYVDSVVGSDSASGKRNDPLRTLHEAFSRIKKTTTPNGFFTVYLKAGQNFVLTKRETLPGSSQLLLRAYGDPKYDWPNPEFQCAGFFALWDKDLLRPTITFQSAPVEDFPEYTNITSLSAGSFEFQGIKLLGPSTPASYPTRSDTLLVASNVVTLYGCQVELPDTGQYIALMAGATLYSRASTYNLQGNNRIMGSWKGLSMNVQSPGGGTGQCNGVAAQYQADNLKELRLDQFGGDYHAPTRSQFGWSTDWDPFA